MPSNCPKCGSKMEYVNNLDQHHDGTLSRTTTYYCINWRCNLIQAAATSEQPEIKTPNHFNPTTLEELEQHVYQKLNIDPITFKGSLLRAIAWFINLNGIDRIEQGEPGILCYRWRGYNHHTNLQLTYARINNTLFYSIDITLKNE